MSDFTKHIDVQVNKLLGKLRDEVEDQLRIELSGKSLNIQTGDLINSLSNRIEGMTLTISSELSPFHYGQFHEEQDLRPEHKWVTNAHIENIIERVVKEIK